MRKLKSMLAAAIAVAMSFTMSVSAFAAEPVATPDDTSAVVASVNENGSGTSITPQNTGGWCAEVKGIGYSYKEVAYAGSGFNCNVRLTMSVPSNYRIDVAMYSGGTLVWEEQNAFNGSRTFWCGNNVTSVRVRVRDALGGAPLLTYTCGVDVAGS